MGKELGICTSLHSEGSRSGVAIWDLVALGAGQFPWF